MTKLPRLACLALVAALAAATALTAVGCKDKGDMTADGKVRLEISNLYFDDMEDYYTDWLSDKFGVSVAPTTYSWADWNEQVTSAVNADNLPDVFHWNLEYNNYPTLKRWAVGGSLKPLPEDLGAYPNLSRVLGGISALDNMKVDGKLYTIPLVLDPTRMNDGYSKFTYVYRKDWAKKLARTKPDLYGDLYKEDDVYTFAEFERLLRAFKTEDVAGSGKTIPLADVEWSFPSVINYYKQAPHAYVYDEAAGGYVWNYTTPEFNRGLDKAKALVDDGLYWADQYSAKEGDALMKYKSGVVGCYFENCTPLNFATLRKEFKANNPRVDVEEGVALMHLKRDDGKFVYEGADNWWSVTLFSADCSDRQMAKTLEIMDWLLGEEGTRLCTYGFEGTDYEVNPDGTIEILWSKKTDGEYASKQIGPKYLRYIVSCGYDVQLNDPALNSATRAAYERWNGEVRAQIAADEAYVMPMYPEMNWQSSPDKDRYAGLRNDAQTAIVKYVFGDGGWDKFNADSRSKYEAVLAEINA